jgi:hypothetical protein
MAGLDHAPTKPSAAGQEAIPAYEAGRRFGEALRGGMPSHELMRRFPKPDLRTRYGKLWDEGAKAAIAQCQTT